MASGAFANYDAWRHTPPLLLATTIGINGWYYPFVVGPEGSLLKFGFPSHIAKAKEAWPVITVGSARISAIGLAIWGCYLARQYKAVDIVIASMGWIGAVDAYVMAKEGADGSTAFRGLSTALVAAWGLFGMTSGRTLWS